MEALYKTASHHTTILFPVRGASYHREGERSWHVTNDALGNMPLNFFRPLITTIISFFRGSKSEFYLYLLLMLKE